MIFNPEKDWFLSNVFFKKLKTIEKKNSKKSKKKIKNSKKKFKLFKSKKFWI